MGNSTGSTMYMFGAVIIIYIVGMLIYQGFQWIRKKREQKRDEEFRAVAVVAEPLSWIFRIKNWISRFSEKKFSKFPVCTANTV